MILRPRTSASFSSTNFVPAWDAVLRTQKQPAHEWQLIAQADHAALAGEMASKIATSDIPKLEPEIIQAITVHDDGWKQIDRRPKKSARPLSFFEETPADIFQAWKGSISSATQIAPIAGILVSEHFCRIARDFSRASTTSPEISQVLTTFIERENAQQEELREQQSRGTNEINFLVDILQFFDLLSLYVCCGSHEHVELPQRFNQNSFRVRREDDEYHLEPPLFKGPTGFSIETLTHSSSATEQISVVFS